MQKRLISVVPSHSVVSSGTAYAYGTYRSISVAEQVPVMQVWAVVNMDCPGMYLFWLLRKKTLIFLFVDYFLHLFNIDFR